MGIGLGDLSRAIQLQRPVLLIAFDSGLLLLIGMAQLLVASRPDGDIEIVCTGLRPGKKLYEELLIDSESEPPPSTS